MALTSNGYLIVSIANLVLSSDVSLNVSTNTYSFTAILKEYDKVTVEISGNLLSPTQITAMATSGEIGYDLGDILGAGAVILELQRTSRGGNSVSFKAFANVIAFSTLSAAQTALDSLV